MVVSSGKSGQYKYYQCSIQVRQNPNLCSSKRIPKHIADKAIREALLEHVFTYEHLSTIYSNTLEIMKNKKHIYLNQMRPITSQISSLQVKVRNLIDLIAEGKIEPNQAVNRNIEEYNSKIAFLRKSWKGINLYHLYH